LLAGAIRPAVAVCVRTGALPLLADIAICAAVWTLADTLVFVCITIVVNYTFLFLSRGLAATPHLMCINQI
jgi:hypothetical protein